MRMFQNKEGLSRFTVDLACQFRRGIVFLSLLGFSLSGQSAAELLSAPASPELVRVRTLIQANVLGLAETILEEQGPPQVPDGTWLNWERQLWSLYRVTGKWRKLVERTQSIPPAFPEAIHEEASLEAADAHIALGESGHARRLLREQLLSQTASERMKIHLRRRIIESYLKEGLFDDAMTAVRLFESDYHPQDQKWFLLAGSVALKSGNPAEAVNLLSPLDDPRVRILRLLARLNEAGAEHFALLERGNQMLQDANDSQWRKPLLAVLIKAAEILGLLSEKIDFMEQYLIEDDIADFELSLVLPHYSVEDLMNSYSELSAVVPGVMNLLQQEDPRWGDVSLVLNATNGVTKRSVWAALVLDNQDTVFRTRAMDEWVRAAIASDRWLLIPLLFGKQAPMGELSLPPHTGLELSYRALEEGDYRLAAQANANNVSVPPSQANAEDWFLYTARISIIAGRHQEGIERLRRLIGMSPKLSSRQVDKVLQVVFMLQEAEQHTAAVELFQMIHSRSPGGKFDREVPLWQAESQEALGRHREAAQLFLQSAMLNNNGFDDWGRSARFRAADALLNGHFFADARALILDLLERAEEPERANGLQRKLEEIWLREMSVAGLNKAVH